MGVKHQQAFNSLAPGRCGCNLELVIFKMISTLDVLGNSSEIALKWMPQCLTDDKAELVLSGSKPLTEPM